MRPETLGALRMTATLTHGTGLRARLRLEERVLLEVRPPTPEDRRALSESPVRTPCAFRKAVAGIHQGRTVACLALPELAGTDPAIEIGVPTGGATFPGGIYRVPTGQNHLWYWAIALDADTAFDLGRDLVEEAAFLPGQVDAFGIRPDEMTGVSLAFARTAAPPDSDGEAQLRNLAESLLARWTAHRLLRAAGALGSNSVGLEP